MFSSFFINIPSIANISIQGLTFFEILSTLTVKYFTAKGARRLLEVWWLTLFLKMPFLNPHGIASCS